MSNHLAIATVTAALQTIIQEGIRTDVPGSRVTTVRPDHSASSALEVGVNIFLYQVTPNPAWRNADLHTRRPKGDLIKHGQAGLDLHYLMTFYGNEQELEPQRLLGSTVRTLVDQPILTPEMIQGTIANPTLSFLANSTLEDQIQLVRFIPSSITTEDLSRIWSIFFQTPYSLSLAYQGTAVLIQGDKPGRLPLPVRHYQYYAMVIPGQPKIDQVTPNGIKQPVTRDSTLDIRGQRLLEKVTHIRIGETIATLRSLDNNEEIERTKIENGETIILLKQEHLTDTRIILNLSLVLTIRAGMQALQILHPPASASNAVPLVICPTIQNETIGSINNLHQSDDRTYSGEVEVQTDVLVGEAQKVFLLLNSILDHTHSYIFTANSRNQDTNTPTFAIRSVRSGEYLMRLKIDGAESPLNVDEVTNRYVSPKLLVPGR
jgi:hypothetical protein